MIRNTRGLANPETRTTTTTPEIITLNSETIKSLRAGNIIAILWPTHANGYKPVYKAMVTYIEKESITVNYNINQPRDIKASISTPLKINENVQFYHVEDVEQSLTENQQAAPETKVTSTTMLTAFENRSTIPEEEEGGLIASQIQELITQDIQCMREIESLKLSSPPKEVLVDLQTMHESLRGRILNPKNREIILTGEGLNLVILSQWQELNIAYRGISTESLRTTAAKKAKIL